ncbi:MAG: Ig-like domain-containing protein [Clostridia bacterium]|nr:Ig-like domain-containing protein [Clostridia bacterium]
MKKTTSFLILFLLCVSMAIGGIAESFDEQTLIQTFEGFTIEELENTTEILKNVLNQKRLENAKIAFNTSSLIVPKAQQAKVTYVTEGREGIKETKVEWSCSDETIATVQKGLITAKTPGTATVTCAITYEDEAILTGELDVTVVDPVKTVTMSEKSMTFFPGDTMGINSVATVTPETASIKTLTWESSDESVAMVSEKGILTAVSSGVCTLTARTVDGSNKSASFKAIVSSIKTEESTYTITERTGLTIPLIYAGSDPSGIKATVKGSVTAQLSVDGDQVSLFLLPTKDGEAVVTLEDSSFKENKYSFAAIVDKSASPAPVSYTAEEVFDNQDSIILYSGDTIVSKNGTYLEVYFRYQEGISWSFVEHFGPKKNNVKISTYEVLGKQVSAWKVRTAQNEDRYGNQRFSGTLSPYYYFDLIDVDAED